jgi:phage shock protein PspC (stress-responsive transcriptional regulator)
MVDRCARPHAARVTTDDPNAATAAGSPAGQPSATASFQPLRRRSGGRVVAGVAAGLADYLNVDPVIVRAVFVGLMIFGGAGLVIYVVGWLIIPAEGADRSVLEAGLGWLFAAPGRLVLLVLAVGVAIWLVFPMQTPAFYVPPGLFVDPGMVFILVVVGIAILLVVRGGRVTNAAVAPNSQAPARPSFVGAPSTSGAAGIPRARVARGPLGWWILAVALLAVGVLALADHATATTVVPGQFFGAVVAVVGLGLVVSAWWGKARLLIVPTLLLVPIAVAASFVTVPLEGGIADRVIRPANPAELRSEYRLLAGRLVLDLRDVNMEGGAPVQVAASVALGDVVAIVPDRALQIDAHAGAGGTYVLETSQVGTSLSERVVRGERSPEFILELGVGIGQVQVWTEWPRATPQEGWAP